MATAGVEGASQTALLATLNKLERGEITSPYTFARSLGDSSAEAHRQPATAAYLRAQTLFAAYRPFPASSP